MTIPNKPDGQLYVNGQLLGLVEGGIRVEQEGKEIDPVLGLVALFGIPPGEARLIIERTNKRIKANVNSQVPNREIHPYGEEPR